MASMDRTIALEPENKFLRTSLAMNLASSGDVARAVRYLRLYLADPKGESQASIKAAEAELKGLEGSLKK